MHRHCLASVLTVPLRARDTVSVRITSSSTRQLGTGDSLPWFMREANTNETAQPVSVEPPHAGNQALPNGLPEHLVTLHRHLSQSPLLAPFTLRICKPNSIRSRTASEDLTLPYSRAKGRRRRGVHDAGQSVGEPDDMWSWYVIAEVKEGTEGRGAIETVIRNAQKELLKNYPQLPIPRKLSRKWTGDGWEVLDLGDSLLHVVSREKSQHLFGVQRQEPLSWHI
ncbi:hypothetical protein FRC08_003101 [Ceratobasidium sp. 394]|nr:hypothetical protein FRC08_003101 [Ceratobasidium sp. 394]